MVRDSDQVLGICANILGVIVFLLVVGYHYVQASNPRNQRQSNE
jgi:hypothetical protein